jgi:multidrug efflux pump subunit AcrA (membrane-fusion protein)
MLLRLCIALSLASLLAACGEERETITPTVGPITESIYASGVVKAQGQYTVYPTVSGTVTGRIPVRRMALAGVWMDLVGCSC